MNRSIVLASVCIAAVAGCTHTVVREHVVEKQPIVQRETVVAPPAQTIIASPATCSYHGTPYASGALSCQSGYQYLCRDGVWDRAGVC